MDNKMLGSNHVKVNVSNSKNDSVALDIKFQKSLTIAELKVKLEVITGGSAGTMRLDLYNGDHHVACFSENTALLGSYNIEDGMRIHVIDNFTSWNDDGDVEKFNLTEEQYERKSDTMRNFLKTNRLGKYNAENESVKEEKRLQQLQEEQKRAEICTIGSRCQVKISGNPTRRGTIMYNGPLEGKSGLFIGVKYDEPLGKNDGRFNGKQYFECLQNYGGFVSPLVVEVGEFPEIFDEEDEI